MTRPRARFAPGAGRPSRSLPGVLVAGFINIVTTPDVYERYRRIARTALFLRVQGKVERSGKPINVKAEHFQEIAIGGDMQSLSRNFH